MCLSGIAQTSSGTVYGRILEADSSTIMPFAKVWVETPGGVVGKRSDVDGKFKFSGLAPGTYIVKAEFSGFAPKGYIVDVSPDGLHELDLVMDNKTFEPVVVNGGPPILETDIISIRIPTADIKTSPYIRNPLALLAGTSSDIKMPEGTNEIIIRGSRPGDAVYYIDGIKMTGMSALPGVAIGSLQAYTGGVPAKYGDTTGGVIIVESKSYFDLYYAWLAAQQ